MEICVKFEDAVSAFLETKPPKKEAKPAKKKAVKKKPTK
jgi:hypothetical protein